MRIGIAQINPILGDFPGNRDKILSFLRQAERHQCDLCVFPESTLFGYHPFDMLERTDLVDLQLKELDQIQKRMPEGLTAILGVITKNPAKKGRPYFNSAVILRKGTKPQFFNKQLLPTGDVFDEARFIENGKISENKFILQGKKKNYRGLITICEDIWAWPEHDGRSQYQSNPLEKIKGRFDIIVNLSASPYYPQKYKRREELVSKTAKRFGAPMLYVNMVGAQDEIIFDGASFALSRSGKKISQSPSFVEDFRVLDLLAPGDETKLKRSSVIQELRQALVLGIRDFCEKSGLEKIHLGLSGGVDSAVVACLAVEAIGHDNVVGIAMPGPFSSSKSLKLAKQLAANLKIPLLEAPIEKLYKAAAKQAEKSFAIKGFSVVHENLQARSRGLLLMAYSNAQNSLLLTTGNKSEYATGYATLYGDMCGGLAPIGDLTKDQVYGMSKLYNEKQVMIPIEILRRPPTAELRPNQKDQDSLPPYAILDKAVRDIVENCKPAKTTTEKWLLQKVLATEFKRWQAPPILKVSRHSFGRGRRYPISGKRSI